MAQFNYKKYDRGYSRFWTDFNRICLKNRVIVEPKSSPFKLIPEGDPVVMALSSLIHLRNWPCRRNPTEKIDILINSVEYFDKTTSQMTNSCVQVSYFQIENKEPTALLNIHYDFKDPPGSGHPFFHAQLSSSGVDWSRSESFKEGYDITKLEGFREQRKTIEGLRIPTPHMNIVSVLVCLAADHLDHLSKDVLDDMRNVTIKNLDLPTVKFKQLSEKINRDAHSYRSCHWYEFIN